MRFPISTLDGIVLVVLYYRKLLWHVMDGEFEGHWKVVTKKMFSVKTLSKISGGGESNI